MKIQLIGHVQPYYYASVLHRISDAFEDNGHDVIRTDRNNIVIENDTDFLLYVDCSEDFSNNMVDTDKPKVFWSFDAHMPDGIERSVSIARKCDMVFATQYEHGVKLLEKFGVEATLLPFTYSERLCIPQKTKKYDVVMIGHNNSQLREELWNGLKERFNCFVGTATKEEYIEAMGSAKIVVCQPTEPWDIILTNRFFEGMGSGALMLSRVVKTNIASKLGFVSERDYFEWDTLEDLYKQIRFWLKDEKAIKRYADNGYKKVQNYSLRNQCHVIETMVLNKFWNDIK